eukprot:TRINITY_DN27382_c0_g3_i1.p1 TRINITY_DN27382_c0_g3~~TRINITY_DN27382_c0_g3_i1.p1  ORF type:complete len:279 (-),score=53.85 TRINITY_DN27382_c0_g3_i1:183-1019(-)
MASVNWMADVQRNYNSYSFVGRDSPNSMIESSPEDLLNYQDNQYTAYSEEAYGYGAQNIRQTDEVLVSKYDELGMHEYDIVDPQQLSSDSETHIQNDNDKHNKPPPIQHSKLSYKSVPFYGSSNESTRMQYLDKTQEAMKKLMKLRVSLNGELWRNAEQVSSSIEDLTLLFVRVSDALSMEELKVQQMKEHMQMQQRHIDSLRQEVSDVSGLKKTTTDYNRQPTPVSGLESYFLTQEEEEEQHSNSESRDTESPESNSTAADHKMSVFAQPFVPHNFT